jgi:phytanoyl-CoA hydroxylase
MLERAAAQRYPLTDNTGSPLEVPLRPADDYAYFIPAEGAAARAYYEEYGYVVLRGLVPAAQLDGANAAFDREVLPSKRWIYRQATANPERHVLTAHGHMLNSILNLQSLDPRHYAAFRGAAEQVLTHPAMQGALQALLGEPGKLVQSMYFHGNPSTWPHQDTYYLDSEHIGAMTAAWIAAEDIAPGAGRFFVYPGSHRIDMRRNGGDFDIAFNHERYKKLVVDIIRGQQLECRAPALARGDVLFWNGKTIHGSLPTSQPEHSRRSLTAHYIPRSHRFLQHQSRIKPMAYDEVNGMQLARPKDQASPKARAVMFVETRFPTTFRTAKKLALKVLAGR